MHYTTLYQMSPHMLKLHFAATAPAGIGTGGRLLPITADDVSTGPHNGSHATAARHQLGDRSNEKVYTTAVSRDTMSESSSSTAIIAHPAAQQVQLEDSTIINNASSSNTTTSAGKLSRELKLVDGCKTAQDTDATSSAADQICDRKISHPQAFTRHHWGQALQYLPEWAAIAAGSSITLKAIRDGPKIKFQLQPDDTPHVPQDAVPAVIFTAPKAPWLQEGVGIEDPDVWAVKKCEQLLSSCLMRVPSGIYPSIWQDLRLMQVRCWQQQ